MSSPFPGMDPHLETRWGDVHSSLAIYARDALNRVLPPDLVASAEERAIVAAGEDFRGVYPDVSIIETEPISAMADDTNLAVLAAEPICVQLADEEIRQRFLEIRDAASGGRVVTVIEFVIPANKHRGDGLDKYLQKQQECHDGKVNLVEIDLTRAGDRWLIMPVQRLLPQARTIYQAWVWRANRPDKGWAYRIPLDRPLPVISVPLRPTDQDVPLDLQELINLVYQNGRYARVINYRQPAEPPLSAADRVWAEELLKQARPG